MATTADDVCIHGLTPNTCTLCLNRKMLRPAPHSQPAILFDGRKTPKDIVDPRRAHLLAFVAAARPGLARAGFGRLTIPTSLTGPLWAEIPNGVWYRRFTQNDKVHSKVTDTTISFRMHMDAYPGDRSRNEAALDIVRDAIEQDLVGSLSAAVSANWRAARGGANQVMELTTSGGVKSGSPESDATWFVDTSITWLAVIRRNSIGNLRQQVAEIMGN